jgi:post-segregation antitoxin (ccd killing protein)
MAARRNISLPEELDEAARAAGLNVSALTQQAIVVALDRKARMARLGAWLDQLDAEHGPPSAEAVAEAEAWFASGVPAVAKGREPLLSHEVTEAMPGVPRPAFAARRPGV